MKLKSFKFAIEGIKKTIKTEMTFRVMLVALLIVVALGFLLCINAIQWSIILICCAGVLALEMINTAIEALVDLITDDHHELAEKVKDISAGLVLIFSIFATIIGLIIFIPYILDLFK